MPTRDALEARCPVARTRGFPCARQGSDGSGLSAQRIDGHHDQALDTLVPRPLDPVSDGRGGELEGRVRPHRPAPTLERPLERGGLSVRLGVEGRSPDRPVVLHETRRPRRRKLSRPRDRGLGPMALEIHVLQEDALEIGLNLFQRGLVGLTEVHREHADPLLGNRHVRTTVSGWGRGRHAVVSRSRPQGRPGDSTSRERGPPGTRPGPGPSSDGSRVRD